MLLTQETVFLNTMKKVLGRIENRIPLGENRFLHLRELDEIILPFEEILDYKAYLKDGYKFVLELTAENDAAFDRVKGRVMREMEDLLSNQPGCRPDVAVIPAAECAPVIINSMIKRKIIDCRKER